MNAIEKIEAQQKKLQEGSAPWCVGEQLKDICKMEPWAAELVDKDLDVPEMDLIHAEKKIKGYADEHKKGSFAFVSPQKAEEIIREFYGIKKGEEPTTAPVRKGRVIDLGDYL